LQSAEAQHAAVGGWVLAATATAADGCRPSVVVTSDVCDKLESGASVVVTVGLDPTIVGRVDHQDVGKSMGVRALFLTKGGCQCRSTKLLSCADTARGTRHRIGDLGSIFVDLRVALMRGCYIDV
jgi:hypothetical protein